MILEDGMNHIQKLRVAFNVMQPSSVAIDKEWIQKKLRHMAEVDQYVINLCMDNGAYTENPDSIEKEKLLGLANTTIAEHAEELKRILKTHDWEEIIQLGGPTLSDAWLLVQHADHDLQFQSHILKKMESLNLINTEEYAYLFDRVAVNSGRPQHYGTQFAKNGEPQPIDDPANLDARRKKIGLISMAEYKDIMAQHRVRFNGNTPS
jgi:hypothetical protein